jgi:hypothetical protein
VECTREKRNGAPLLSIRLLDNLPEIDASVVGSRWRMAKKFALQEKLGSYATQRGLAARCPLRFFGAINGGHCERAFCDFRSSTQEAEPMGLH